MTDIVFKKIDADDYPAVAELYNYYIANSTATYHIARRSTDEVIDFFDIGYSSTYAFCIYQRNQFCGFCLIRQYNRKEGYKFTCEITIYLEETFSHRGIGTIAAGFLENIAWEKGIKTIVAGICAENEASIRLFEKCGYERCGYFKNMGYKFGRVLDNVYYQKFH